MCVSRRPCRTKSKRYRPRECFKFAVRQSELGDSPNVATERADAAAISRDRGHASETINRPSSGMLFTKLEKASARALDVGKQSK